MTNTKRGISSQSSKRFYMTMTIPSMLSATDVFPYLPGPRTAPTLEARSSQRLIERIERLESNHHQAAIMIIAAMHTTVSDVTEAYANL
jgi:hypothetical protein